MDIVQIRTLAEEYATKYNPERLVPFPYENILKDMSDLRIYYTTLDDDTISGATLFRDNLFSILINTNKPMTRQHFTLGHELGHYFLHKDILREQHALIDGDKYLDGSSILYRQDGADPQQIELQANNFAASLIMPTHLVQQAWDATQSIQACARIFKVSAIAMSVRLTKMGIIKE